MRKGNKQMYTLNDFFCGCGGLGLGLQNSGFKIVGAWDFDKYAVETYRRNIGNHVVQADIQELHIADIPEATAWSFGFPCQDLSVAGNQNGIKLECSDCGEVWEVTADNYNSENKCPKCGSINHKAATRSGMFFEIMRLLHEAAEEALEKLPKILIAENVKALRPYIPVLEAEYKKAGYRCYHNLFNSMWWGVPQHRERYIVVGIREDLTGEYIFPEEQHENIPKLSTILEKGVAENFYISDEKAATIIEQAKTKLESLGYCHATITPDRVEKRQNGRRAKEDEAPMFTLTAQDLHGVIINSDVEREREREQAIKAIICKETGLLNPNGIAKTLRVGGNGSLSKKHNYQHVLE